MKIFLHNSLRIPWNDAWMRSFVWIWDLGIRSVFDDANLGEVWDSVYDSITNHNNSWEDAWYEAKFEGFQEWDPQWVSMSIDRLSIQDVVMESGINMT